MNVSLYTILHHCFIIIQLVYKVQCCAFKGDTQNLPLRRVGRREIPPYQIVGQRVEPQLDELFFGVLSIEHGSSNYVHLHCISSVGTRANIDRK
jgi:hypothetical protein